MPAQLTVTRLENALKHLYVFDSLVKVYRQYNFALSNLEMHAGRLSPLGGRTMRFSLETAGVPSFRFMNEGEPVADAGVPTWAEATVTMASCSSQIEFDIWAEGYTKAAEASYVKSTSKLLSSTVEQFATKLSLALWGQPSGAIARVKTVDSGTQITLYADGETGGGDTHGVKAIFKGGWLSASVNLTGTGTLRDWSQEVASVNPSTNVVTFTSTTNLVADDYLFWGSKERSSKGRSFNGFLMACDDGTLAGSTTYQGIDRTAAGNQYWQGNVTPSFGTGNLEAGFISELHNVRKLIKANTNVIITSLGVWRAYFNELKEDRRVVVPVSSREGLNFTGGFDSLSIHDGTKTVPVVADEEAPSGKAWGLRWSDFFLGKMYEPQWLDRGEGIFKNKAEHLEYAAYFFAIMQLVCRQPQAQWLMTGITEAD